MSNPYEISGRLTKAFAIAQALFRAGITADAAELLTADEWAKVAAVAGYPKPPSEETRQICLEKLAGFARSEAA